MSSINRKCHCLKPVKSLAMPRHLLFVDTETFYTENDDGETSHRLRLGWACYWRRGYGRHLEKFDWHYFETVKSFWQFALSKATPKVKLWIIARNLVFDFTILNGWQKLRQADYKLRFFYSFGATSLISVRKKGSSIMFVDSMNWFRESLATTGDRIGIPKMKIDFKTCSKKELKEYCRNDVNIELVNFKGFIRFLEGNQIAKLSYTIASTAMNAYLFGSYHRKIYIHNNKEAIDLERESYKGGRVECFQIGDLSGEYFHVLDVNSLYPFVMANNLYPVKYSHIRHNIDIKSFAIQLEKYAAIAKVRIRTLKPVYAVKTDRTIFPVGGFWCTLTTPELKYALEQGDIEYIADVVFYKQADIFSHYVNKLYTLRQDFKSAGVKAYEQLCKLLLNSLYGKFGQKAELWEKIGQCQNEPDRIELLYRPNSNHWYKLRYLLGEVWESNGFDEAYNSFPAIASHVTAYGRLYLYKLMELCGWGNYVYCDTDSLIVNNAGLVNLENQLDDMKIGCMKIEDVTENLIIRGLKDYQTEKKTVIKGISKHAVKLSDGKYQQESWPSFAGILNGTATDIYTVKSITKTLTREYTKGNVTESGIVLPFVLDDVGLQTELPF